MTTIRNYDSKFIVMELKNKIGL